jgi:hypothetical protein
MHHHTTRRSARRYVEQGRARWVAAGVIEFVVDHPRHQAAALDAGQRLPHSPTMAVVEQRAIGRYRNDVLGLPNFVGFVREGGTRSRLIAA